MPETSPAPVTLLLDANLARLLGAFCEPRTAAEAARALGEPANRIGHRVRKLKEAGLLREVTRKGRKVYLQATQLEYELPPSSALLDASLKMVEQRLQQLGVALRKQIERRILLGDCSPEEAFAKVSLRGRPSPDFPLPKVYLATAAISAQGRQRLQELTQELIRVIESEKEQEGPKTLIGLFVLDE